MRRHQSHVYRQDRTVFKYPLRFICYLIVAVNYCRQLHRNGSSCDLRVMLVAQRALFMQLANQPRPFQGLKEKVEM